MKKNSLAFIAFAVVMLVSAVANAECRTCIYRDERGRCVSEKCETVDMDPMNSLDGSLIETGKRGCLLSAVPHCSKMDSSCNCTACATGYALSGGACKAKDSGSSTTTVSPVTSCPDGTKKSSDGCCCIPV